VGTDRSRKAPRPKRGLVSVKASLDEQPPMILAAGSEAVAGIAQRLMKLAPAQRGFLRLRYYFETDAACATDLGIPSKTVATWKARDRAFNAAYTELLAQPLIHARAEMMLLTQKAIHGLGELLDSPNPQVRQAAIDRVLKGRDAQLLQSNVKVETDDGADLFTALIKRMAAAKAAQPATPATGGEPGDQVVDAEYREVPTAS